ncbi:hypothetical protein PQX77_012840 [Marasmius sp. AFHP31]|nr:hypothetical protein PQX77_012840 [Marasmius sp. AFHP31]
MDLEALQEALYKSDVENVLDELAKVGSVSVLNYLQDEADLTTDKSYRKRCIQCLCEAVKRYQTLPPTLFLRDIEKEHSSWPLRGGGFADIWKGRSTSDGRSLCLKVLRMFAESDEVRRKKIVSEFCREALVWRQLNHPNVLPFLGVNTELFAPGFCLVLPWMENGDILKYMKKHSTHDLLKSLREIAAGIAYLHSHEPNIVHGDIRGANILVTDDLTCALADFGLAVATESKIMPTSSGSSMKGSTRWLAPEVMSGDRHWRVLPETSTHLDLLTLQPPFASRTEAGVILEVASCRRPKRPEDLRWCTDELWDLVERCWAHEPHTRPKANDAFRELEEMSTSVVSPSFEPPLVPTSSLAPCLEPEHSVHGLELAPPPRNEPVLPVWLTNDSVPFPQTDDSYVAPIPSLQPPISVLSIPSDYRTPSPQPPSGTSEVRDTPSTPTLKLEELWSTPTRQKRSGKDTQGAEAKRDLGSNILNLSLSKRPASRGSSDSDGGSDENSHPGSDSDSRTGASSPIPIRTRRTRRRMEGENEDENEDANRIGRRGVGGTGGGKIRRKPETTRTRGTKKPDVSKGKIGQGRVPFSALPPPEMQVRFDEHKSEV